MGFISVILIEWKIEGVMSIILNLPTEFSRSVLVEWLKFPEVVRLDTAHLSHACRQKFLTLCNGAGPAFKNGTKVSTNLIQCLAWLIQRNVQVSSINFPYDMYNSRRASNDFFNHCSLRLTELQIHNFGPSPNWISCLSARHCPLLESIEVYHGRTGEMEAFFENLSTNWPGLKTLSIVEYDCTAAFVLPNLINFHFDANSFISESMILSIAKHSPQLSTLSLNSVALVDVTIAAAIGRHCHHLQSLKLYGNGFGDPELLAMLPACSNLSWLTLSRTNISNATMLAVAQTCTKLTTLTMDAAFLESNVGIDAVLRANSQIKMLVLVKCMHLDVDQLIFVIAEHCPQLQRLNLISSPLHEPMRLYTLAWRCKALKLIAFTTRRSELMDSEDTIRRMFPPHVTVKLDVIEDYDWSSQSEDESDGSNSDISDNDA